MGEVFGIIVDKRQSRLFLFALRSAAPEGEALQAANLNHHIFYHRVGTPQSDDKLIYERPDEPEWLMSAHVTEDGRYALIYLSQSRAEKSLVLHGFGRSAAAKFCRAGCETD